MIKLIDTKLRKKGCLHSLFKVFNNGYDFFTFVYLGALGVLKSSTKS